ncbi:uncharacterized protein G2W53_008433 [Senna tora]|uniref:Uncharacterized protein n=1 Tax=Senna tora TaxID=362788 RepID=A0A835CEL9_9FABA|nr:uncharacterized protein G2W53_008433 [Senna tora]
MEKRVVAGRRETRHSKEKETVSIYIIQKFLSRSILLFSYLRDKEPEILEKERVLEMLKEGERATASCAGKLFNKWKAALLFTKAEC